MERRFTLPICRYCRSRFVCFQTQLRSFPQQQPVRTETHTGERIWNVMIRGDLHYSLRSLANVCLRVRGGGCRVWGNRGLENHIHMVKQPQRAPFSIHFYPQHNHQIPHSPPNTHTHKHTSVVLERRLKYYDRCSSPDRLHSSNAAGCITSFSPWRWLTDWPCFLSGFMQGAPGPHGNPGQAGPSGLKVSHRQLFEYIMHWEHSSRDCFPIALWTAQKNAY